MDNTLATFYAFAWESLTTKQQYRITMKYELMKELESLNGRKKRHVYRAIATKYGHTMKRVEDIANKDLK